MRRHPFTDSGFSLLELIIVLTILAIMSAAVVPVFQGTFASVEGDHAVRDFVATLRYVQERAITDSIEYRLYLDPENNQYYVMRYVSLDEDMEKKVFERYEEGGRGTVVLPPRIKIKRPRAQKDRELDAYYVSFFPSGACDEVRLTLERERDDGGDIVIETNGGIGRLKVTNQ